MSAKSATLPLASSKAIVWARFYASKGWHVFPLHPLTSTGECGCGPNCRNPGKHPMVEDWPNVASVDPAKIGEWWMANPERGIGIVTGERSGLTVLDVDGDEGAASLTKYQNGEGMPATPCVVTRPGRFHYYFQYNPAVKSEAGKLGAKLDTRCDGGFCVAPPSRHATGPMYTWFQKPTLPLAEWPAFFSAKIIPFSKSKAGRPEHERFNPDNPHDVSSIQQALEFVDPDDEERWTQIGWIMGRAFRQSDAGYALYSAWAARSRKYDRKVTKEHYYEASKKPIEHLKTTKHIYEWATANGFDQWSFDKRRNIIIQEGAHNIVIDTAVATLALSGGLYDRATKMVRVVTVREAKALGLRLPGQARIQRDEDMPTLVEVEPEWLRYRLGELARFYKDQQLTNCPPDVARGILSLAKWEGIPFLRSVAHAPFLRSDGTICDQPGFDDASSVLLWENDAILPVPVAPTLSDALAALERVLEPFSEIPFCADRHRAAFLAFVLTLAARPILPVVPGTIFDAPTAGTGKTLCVECASVMVYGIAPSVRSFPTEGDELRKVLGSAALAGDLLIMFDNIKAGSLITGASLNAYMTAEATADRILGQSRTPRMVNTTTLAFTGNNIGALGETIRRTLRVQLDADTPNPEKRRFKIPNLKKYLREHRPELLRDVLTILRAFVVAGAPSPEKRRPLLGSFERWDELVAGCLLWLGMDDPLLTQEDMRGDDTESDDMDEVFRQLLNFRPDGSEFQVRDLMNSGGKDLMMAFRSVLECQGSDVTAKLIGQWLKAHKNKLSSDGTLKLVVSSGTTQGAKRYHIRVLTPEN
jgi:hypothetical protein